MATAAAKRYAKAVFELAQAGGDFDRWESRLAEVRNLFSNARVASVLANPTIPAEDRESLVAAAHFDQETTNLARLLVESGRVEDIGAIADEFQALVDEAQGRVRATVTTAIELAAHDRDRVASELSKRLDKQVRLTVVVDPSVIGGLRLQYGDRVVDATVANRLEQLRRRLAAT
ncbi:MAG TPA: F0F1 ATP synthase subunit delta [Candidatus Dormibacteraeota bacterium]|nr:F0F1 ATP synthase subunit delta [Candidatus Dormibacteraeota bacterium]